MSMIDRLEPRRLMADVGNAYVNAKGTLFVNGTDGADTVAIAKVDGGYQVTFKAADGTTQTFGGFSAKRVQQIRLDVGDGDDRVAVEKDVNERATLLGGAGDDRIDLFSGASVLVEGGSGKDRIRHDTDATTPGATATHVDADGKTSLVFGGRSTLNGGSGNDVITAGSPGDTIDGGTGTDSVLLRPGIGYVPGTSAVLVQTAPGSFQVIGTSTGPRTIVFASSGSGTYSAVTTLSISDVVVRRVERLQGTTAADA